MTDSMREIKKLNLSYYCHMTRHTECLLSKCECLCHIKEIIIPNEEINQALREYNEALAEVREVTFTRTELAALYEILKHEYVNENEHPLAMRVIRRIQRIVENENVDRSSSSTT